jgi:cysteine synthase A
MNVYSDNSYAIGRTPLVRFNRISGGALGTVYGKVEGRNPAYSVKCRVAASMVWAAEAAGRLKPGMHLLEASSGNTGIGLAFVAAARGYKLTLVMQEGMSEERVKVLKMLGAEVVLTDPNAGMQGALDKAEALEGQQPEKYCYTRQFENPSNPAIHESTTGPEIWADLDGQIDVLVAGVGTGGTITGLGRFFRARGRKVEMVAVEPRNLPAISKARSGEPLEPAGHLIQGIGAGFVPKNLDLSVLDRVEQVADKEAIQMARRLSRDEGILSGISCGAAAFVAVKLASLAEYRGKNIVCILPDAGDRYVSTVLFGDLFEGK